MRRPACARSSANRKKNAFARNGVVLQIAEALPGAMKTFPANDLLLVERMCLPAYARSGGRAPRKARGAATTMTAAFVRAPAVTGDAAHEGTMTAVGAVEGLAVVMNAIAATMTVAATIEQDREIAAMMTVEATGAGVLPGLVVPKEVCRDSQHRDHDALPPLPTMSASFCCSN